MTGLPEKYVGRITLRVREAAEVVGVSVDSIEALIGEGHLTVTRLRGGERGLRLITVDSLLRHFGVPTGAPADTTDETEGE